MRPVSGDTYAERPRKVGREGPPQPSNVPTTFFLRREEELRQPLHEPSARLEDSMYGVQSLEDALGEAFANNGAEERSRSDLKNKDVRKSPSKAAPSKTLSSQKLKVETPISSPPSQRASRRASVVSSHSACQPASPPPNSAIPSTPRSGSVKSLQLSDGDSLLDDTASQILEFSEGEGEGEAETTKTEEVPQLVMPSIRMPDRRPFTQRGKELGRLKILVTGETGTGKTSLIESIIRTCEDIIHVDPTPDKPALTPYSPPSQHPSPAKQSHLGTTQITEIHASTRAYPPWWSDFEDSRVLRRRKSYGESVLERNLCFIDTPGSSHDDGEIGLQHVETLLRQNASFLVGSDSDITNTLTGSSGFLVDVVLCLLSPDTYTTSHLASIQRLHSLTNVIPLVAKADTYSEEQLAAFKESVRQDMESANVYSPGHISSDPFGRSASTVPYAVSSVLSSDADNMDASLLMSPDYIQPLVPSDLNLLKDYLFDPDSAAALRHRAIKKFLGWRRARLSPPQRSTSPTARSAGASGALIPRPTSRLQHHPLAARVAREHPQREEHVTQVRLARWAMDLQRSMRNERERHERLAQGEHVDWLTTQLGQHMEEGTLVQVQAQRVAVIKHAGDGEADTFGPTSDPRDPLGLLAWNERMQRRAWLAVQVVGGCGVVGALAIWAVRHWRSAGEGADERLGGWLAGLW